MIKLITLILFIFLTGCNQKQNYLVINDHKINIEVADTIIKREQGLSGRDKICQDCGMIFVFDKPGKYGFWMKDMKFPLDFIYINNSEVADLKENVSPDTYPEIIIPESSFDKVIEVNAGFISKNKIMFGQKISY